MLTKTTLSLAAALIAASFAPAFAGSGLSSQERLRSDPQANWPHYSQSRALDDARGAFASAVGRRAQTDIVVDRSYAPEFWIQQSIINDNH